MSDKNDPALGERVHKHLSKLGIETPIFLAKTRKVREQGKANAKNKIQGGVQEMFESVGLDMTDDSLKDTPRRVADMYIDELFTGLDYNNFPKCTNVANKIVYDEMVMVGKIATLSVCEHHLQTIDGYTWIAYIPNKKVLGLSKFARITEFFARRPQIQERMTVQIQSALAYILETDSVAVVNKSTHYCMKARGVGQQESTTITSKVGGKFFSVPALRAEFLSLIKE